MKGKNNEFDGEIKNCTVKQVSLAKVLGLTAAHEKISRQRDELKLKREREDVYDAPAVDNFLTELILTARNKFLGLGHKVAPRATEAASICAAIDSEVEEMCRISSK